MLLPEQSKAARAALGWDTRALSAAAGVSAETVARFERGEAIRLRFLDALRCALEAAGIKFGHSALRMTADWRVERYYRHGRGPKHDATLLSFRAVVALAVKSSANRELIKVKAPPNASIDELDHLYKLGVQWL